MNASPLAVLEALDALNEIGASYLVTGSLARNFHAVPRSTKDGDFVVDMSPAQLHALFNQLQKRFEREPQMSFETVTGKTQHKFRHRESKFLIEIFEAHMDDPHERARFERRIEAQIDNRIGFVPTAEDVIVQKLRWLNRIRRPKDRDDVIDVMIFQWESLDWVYVAKWCAEHGSEQLLDELKDESERKIKRD